MRLRRSEIIPILRHIESNRHCQAVLHELDIAFSVRTLISNVPDIFVPFRYRGVVPTLQIQPPGEQPRQRRRHNGEYLGKDRHGRLVSALQPAGSSQKSTDLNPQVHLDTAPS